MALGNTADGNFLALTAPATNTQAITVICWVRFTGLPGTGGFQSIWSIDDNATNFLQPFLDNPSGTVSLKFTVFAGFDITLLTSPVVNQWYRIAIVHTPGAANDATYLNKPGQAPTKATSGTNGMNLPDTTCFVFNERGNDSFVNGEIAGFQFFDRVLSEQEIRAGYNQLSPVTTNRLRYYLPLVEKGAPEINRAGFGPKATYTGSLSWSGQAPPLQPRFNKNFGRSVFNAPVISAPQLDSIFFGAGTTN
jgi:concanavalin A-like lectin/glucanase superfamily protein